MFTGIIEAVGEVLSLEAQGKNIIIWVKSPISDQLTADQSVSHNGICLTIEEINNGSHRVTAIDETVNKTSLCDLKKGHRVNLERSMMMNGRIDGHIVQGHVDGTAVCSGKKDADGSVEFRFRIEARFAPLIVEKGSICLDGISLTAFDISNNEFSVAIIPYTFEHTNFSSIIENSLVNIEFDILGKYVNRMLELHRLNG